MNLAELVAKTRTVRRFQEERPLTEAFMCGLIDLARLSGSARNAQALQDVLLPAPGSLDQSSGQRV